MKKIKHSIYVLVDRYLFGYGLDLDCWASEVYICTLEIGLTLNIPCVTTGEYLL